MIPEGSNSTKIEIEISECEYCGSTQQKKVGGVQVQGYSKSALVVEKLRAICQQHPNYVVPHTTKNRARDFVDIYSLMQGYSEDFFEQCAAVLEPIFTAKHVPIKLLEKILSDDAFVESQRLGFAQVKATIKGRTYEFETYLEFVRAFVVRLLKSIKI